VLRHVLSNHSSLMEHAPTDSLYADSSGKVTSQGVEYASNYSNKLAVGRGSAVRKSAVVSASANSDGTLRAAMPIRSGSNAARLGDRDEGVALQHTSSGLSAMLNSVVPGFVTSMVSNVQRKVEGVMSDVKDVLSITVCVCVYLCMCACICMYV
jgi:hypothetical protein